MAVTRRSAAVNRVTSDAVTPSPEDDKKQRGPRKGLLTLTGSRAFALLLLACTPSLPQRRPQIGRAHV